MRKSLIDRAGSRAPQTELEWLDIEALAKIEMTSEDPSFPIEGSFSSKLGSGWRAAERGTQNIRVVFDKPMTLHRIRLEFRETEVKRTQEFTLRWSATTTGSFKEIIRQQWNFSLQGSTSEVEDYQVELENVSALELLIKPDISSDNAFATLALWRIA